MPKIRYTFPHNFPTDREAADLIANKSVTSWQKVVVMEFGKRHDTTDTTVFCPRQLVTDLLRAGKLVQWMYTVGLKRMTVRGLTAGVVIMRCDHAAVVCLVS